MLSGREGRAGTSRVYIRPVLWSKTSLTFRWRWQGSLAGSGGLKKVPLFTCGVGGGLLKVGG